MRKEFTMRSIHMNVKALTAYLTKTAPVCGIKLTRLRERHAEAMGCNSHNHLISLIKSNSVPEVDEEDYIDSLSQAISNKHKLLLSDEQKETITDFIFDPDTSVFYLTLVASKEYDGSKLPESDHVVDGQVEQDYDNCIEALKGGRDALLSLVYLLPHDNYARPNVCLHISSKPNAAAKGHPLGYYTAIITTETDEEGDYECIGYMASAASDMIQEQRKAWVELFSEISFDFKEGLSAELDVEYSTIVLDGVSSLLELRPSVSEIEEFKSIPDIIKNSCFAKGLDCKVELYNDEDNYCQGYIADGLLLDTIHLLSDDNEIDVEFASISPSNFTLLLQQYDIQAVSANTIIGHNDGVSIIYGCMGFDSNNNPTLRFQLFSYDACEESVKNVFEEVDIDFNVVQELEFRYSYETIYSIPHREHVSHMLIAPQYHSVPMSFSAIAFIEGQGTPPSYKDGYTLEANLVIPLFNNAITETEANEFGIKLLPPVPVPYEIFKDRDAFKSVLNDVTAKVFEKGMTNKNDIYNAIINRFIGKGYEFGPHACVSIVAYSAIGDVFEHLISNIMTVQGNIELDNHKKIAGEDVESGIESLLNPPVLDPSAFITPKSKTLLKMVTGADDIAGIRHFAIS